jgi:uncharacterized protein YkwD
MPALLLSLLAATAALAPSPAPCPERQPLTVTTLCLVNQVREAHGLPRLRLDPRLARVARRHSREMVRKRYFSHTSPDGRSSSDRIAASEWMRGRKRWAVGETLAWHIAPALPSATVEDWLNSPSHRRILLSRRYHVVGIGIADRTPSGGPGTTYTADFGS